jgi:hypothetical protein
VIPVEIDTQAILADLAAWGWRDAKIEMAANLSRGYVAQVRFGNIKMLSYQFAARLHNLWESEAAARGVQIAAYGHLQTRLSTETTS